MEFKFTEDNLNLINAEIAKYPHKKSVVMKALYLGQEQNGYITTEVMVEIAKILEITVEEVLGVVTFYTMYHQKPIGKYHIQVCTNVSCMLRGAYELWDNVKQKYNIDNGGLTSDGKFSLEEVECMGSCGTAPMIAINEDFYENLSKDKLDQIFQSLG